MRNLKRVLSLALATAMLFSMMVIGASAADKKPLTDLDKVNNKEAVNLMVDLGIIVGKPDGSFAPAELINRATMAKLITYIMMGDINPDLFAGVSTDLKDISKNWAKGYINFCYSNGIITGDGAGHFMPDADVTLVAAAKMLLVAIGYDASVQGYVGANWSVNIMRDAKLAGLLEGVNAGTNEKLTRDNASRMIFNALFINTITYSTQWDGGKPYKANPTNRPNGVWNPTLGAQQYSLTTVAAAALTANEANTGSSLKGKSTIGNSTVPVASKIEDIGKNVYYYTFTKDGKLNYSSNAVVDKDVRVVSVPDNLIAGATASPNKNVGEWLAQNGLREVTGVSTTTASYTNYGSAATIATGSLNAALIAVTSGNTAYVIDNNDDGVIDALVVNSLVIDFVTGDVKTAVSGSNTTVYVPGVLNGYINVNNVVGYEGLVKDDVVFTMTVNSTITFISKAENFTGKLTGFNTAKNTVSIDGTVYEISPIAATAFDTAAEYVALGYTDTLTFWKDSEGQLAFAKSPSAATSTLAIVLGYQAGSVVGDGKGQVKLLNMDGTMKVVDVSANTSAATISGLGGATNSDAIATFVPVTFTVDDNGSYTLKLASADSYTWTAHGAGVNGAAITKNSATGVMSTTTPVFAGYVGTANTVFLTAKKNATGTITGYSVATGIANAPAYTAGATGAIGKVLHKNGVASIVLIDSGTSVSGGSGDYLFTQTRGTATYDATAKTYTIDAFVNGVKAPTAVSKAVYENALTANGLYKVDVVDGVVTGATPASFAKSGTGVDYMNGVVAVATTAGTIDYWTYKDSTRVYVVDSASGSVVVTNISVENIVDDTNDSVSVYGNGTTKVADVIVITKNAMATVATPASIGALIDATSTITTTAGLTAGSGTVTAAIAADWTSAAALATAPALTTTASNKFVDFSFKAAAATTETITIKVESVGGATTKSTTITIPAGPVAAQTGSLELAVGNTGLKYTITVTDGSTEAVQVYTQAFTGAIA